jgi:predicted PurR-regulated permease PerM
MLKSSNGEVIKLPFYARATFILTGIFIFITMLCLGRAIIVPLLFSTIIAILLSVLVDFLEKHKVDRLLAIILTVAMTMMIIVGMLFLIYTKINLLVDAFPELLKKFDELQAHSVAWLTDHFGVRSDKLNYWINEARADVTTLSGERLGNTIQTMSRAMVLLVLIPVYIFLLLYYQPLLIVFVHKFAGDGQEEEVGIVLSQTRTILKGYFAGLLIEMVIVAALNSLGYLILGIEFAILIGILGAVLNMIPYIGGLITLGLSVLIVLLTKNDPIYAVYVALMFLVIQIIDNNFLVPKIVASKVRINALVAIVVVIAGGAMWGIPGMFLAIPLTAILKVIFDRIEPLQSWGLLLGDTMPPMVRIKLPKRKPKT